MLCAIVNSAMWKLALRNIARHRGRTLLTGGAIALGVASLIVSAGFIEDFFIQLREATIHSQYGHLQVYRRGYYEFASRAPYHYMIENPDVLAARLRAVDHVVDVAPRVYFSGLLSNGRMRLPVIGEGVGAAHELKLSTHISLAAGRPLLPKMRYAVIVGEGLARSLDLKVGDNATLLVTTRDGA